MITDHGFENLTTSLVFRRLFWNASLRAFVGISLIDDKSYKDSWQVFVCSSDKVIHLKYNKHMKKVLAKAICADKKWTSFWQISLYIK